MQLKNYHPTTTIIAKISPVTFLNSKLNQNYGQGKVLSITQLEPQINIPTATSKL